MQADGFLYWKGRAGIVQQVDMSPDKFGQLHEATQYKVLDVAKHDAKTIANKLGYNMTIVAMEIELRAVLGDEIFPDDLIEPIKTLFRVYSAERIVKAMFSLLGDFDGASDSTIANVVDDATDLLSNVKVDSNK